MTIKQLSVFLENKTGRINEVTRILGSNGINMNAFSLAENSDFGILRMVVSDVDAAKKILREANFAVSTTEVVCFSCSNTPGALSVVLDYLAKDGVFIEYMYAFSQVDTANVVIRPTDVSQCLETLQRYKCSMISASSLYNI